MAAGHGREAKVAPHEPHAAGPPAVPAGSSLKVRAGCCEPRTARGPKRFMSAEPGGSAQAASHATAPESADPPVRPGPAVSSPPEPTLEQWAGGTGLHNLALVFTDIVDNAKLKRAKGDKDWNPVVSGHFALALRLVSQKNGWLVKTIGDAVLAAFRNAVDALGFAVEFEQHPGHAEIRIRAGGHVGQVQVSDGDISGTEVDFASRVCGMAKTGGIWVSDRFHEDCLRYDPQQKSSWHDEGHHELKGLGKHRLWSWRLSGADPAKAPTGGDEPADAEVKREPETADTGALQPTVWETIRKTLEADSALSREVLAAMKALDAPSSQAWAILRDEVNRAGFIEAVERLKDWLVRQTSIHDPAEWEQLVCCLSAVGVNDAEWLRGERGRFPAKAEGKLKLPSAPLPMRGPGWRFYFEMVIAALKDRPAAWDKSGDDPADWQGVDYVHRPPTPDLRAPSDLKDYHLRHFVENLLRRQGLPVSNDFEKNLRDLRANLKRRPTDRPLYTEEVTGDPLFEDPRLLQLVLVLKRVEEGQELVNEATGFVEVLRQVNEKLGELHQRSNRPKYS
jgi:class 3 adenylate cyclase